MIKKILIGLAASIVLFVIFVAMRPADYRVERSAVIAASPAVVFEQFSNRVPGGALRSSRE